VAKLPESMRKAPDRHLEEMEIGEAGYVTMGAMHVTPDLECWLHLETRIQSKPGLLEILRVTRRGDGYHVALLAHYKWAPEPLPPSRKKKNYWVPVVTLTEDYDPEKDKFFRAGQR
jgi:hypothetical protein